jgi:DsbC/DsbD-like thiol-disulfide interchange protein
MIATALRQWVTATTLTVLALGATTARAADASIWDGDAHSAMRLVAGTAGGADRTSMRAGIELRLAAGWKTYWRYPGDSGVPPRFDFSKSTNVKSVTVRWPAPHRFSDESGASIGYKDGVLLPLEIVPANPRQPITLRATVEYAICEKLCVPAAGSAALGLGGASSFDAAISAAQARVPKPAPLDLFAEGPTEEWALPLPEPMPATAPGRRRYSFELDGLPPGATAAGATLRFTLVSGDKAIEVTMVLD